VTRPGEWQSDRGAGPSGSGNREADSGADPSGDSGADSSGDSGADPSGDPGADPSGDPDDRPSGSGVQVPNTGAYAPGHSADPLSKQARLTVWVRGRVQGVGFRWWAKSVALELGLNGMAENLIDGRVKIIAEGNRDSCLVLLERLEGRGTPGQVVQVTHRWDQARGGLAGFTER
jgi:acylphosphatase